MFSWSRQAVGSDLSSQVRSLAMLGRVLQMQTELVHMNVSRRCLRNQCVQHDLGRVGASPPRPIGGGPRGVGCASSAWRRPRRSHRPVLGPGGRCPGRALRRRRCARGINHHAPDHPLVSHPSAGNPQRASLRARRHISHCSSSLPPSAGRHLAYVGPPKPCPQPLVTAAPWGPSDVFSCMPSTSRLNSLLLPRDLSRG